MSEHLYSTRGVLAVAGITHRQLDHWRRIGLVWPAVPANGSGTVVGYDAEDLRWICAIAQAVRAGVTPGAILAALGRSEVSDWADTLRSAADALEEARPRWALLQVG